MKNILKITFGILFIALLFSACEEYDDFMTGDAKTGGLIVPSKMIPYKLGLTPSLDINIEVRQGAPIETIHVSYYYMRMSDTTVSNTLTFDIPVGGANATEEINKTMTYTWDQLREGIVLPTGPQIPASDLDPTIGSFIGDYWLFSYTVTLSDGRKIINNNKTTVSIANFFAGTYDVELLYFHPTAGGTYPTEAYGGVRKLKKDLVPVSPYTCYAFFGVWEDNVTNITIDASNNVSITFDRDDAISGDPYDATKVNSYDPETGVIQIYYHYYGSGGPRIFWEKFTPKN